MENGMFLMDMMGTFAFASYGAYFAIKKDFDIFGIFVCAFLPGVGGGTIREIILGHIPFYFSDSRYILNIIIAIIFTIFVYKHFHRINNFMLFLDAIGLVAFAIIGSEKALGANMGLFGFIFFATITSVGGGIMRDIVMNKVPEIMHSDFYASVAIIIGLVFWTQRDMANNALFIGSLFVTGLAMRMLAIASKFNLWRPPKNISLEKLVPLRMNSIFIKNDEND